MPEEPRFSYGGQAVIEGVMIRGRSHFSLAVRRLDGTINSQSQRLNELFTGRARRVPLVRGVVALFETLVLGTRALHLSANMAMQSQGPGDADEIPGWMLGATLAVALVFGIGVFFLSPLLAVWLLDSLIPTASLLSEIIEGVIRLVLLLAYIWGISFIRDVKRVFAYHGAEHMAVHAYEAGLTLDVANVRKFGTPHPRCGTAFLLTVILVSIVVFALLMAPSMEWRIISRIVLIPVIASVSYEIIRFSGAHQNSWIGHLLARPGLLLQRLTTRVPDDGQIEVAICAMETAMAADAGREAEITSLTEFVEGWAGTPASSAGKPPIMPNHGSPEPVKKGGLANRTPGRESGITVTGEEVAKCPFCGWLFEDGRAKWKCSVCDVVHHLDCLQANKNTCAVLTCKSSQAELP